MIDPQEQLYSIYQQIEKLEHGQARALERLLKQAIETLNALAEADNFQLLRQLNHTLKKEVWVANNQKSITTSTPKYKIKQQEEAFEKAKNQVLHELFDFKPKAPN
jgi:nucleotidyltransferase/DNA polymerase involved in DNA repair